ncbi:MAG: hypothetical protein H0T46_32790 [Deltaproteobacteria bacterium]|nr:hypothetical protein [Deltaproteobacteria bacterium]
MARTFVTVELVGAKDKTHQRFWTAMRKRGFARTMRGQPSRRTLRLPDGVYWISKLTPREALELTREAVRTTKVEARIFCLPVKGDVRFGNLKFDDVAEPVA